MENNYCNNCGKQGHLFHQCKIPITSIGIIAFRINKNKKEYLLIRRKNTLGYVDFMRGKYSVHDKDYILNMMKQMTNEEKNKLKSNEFDEIWNELWGHQFVTNQYKSEEIISKDKFNSLKNGILIKTEFYNLASLLDESMKYYSWNETEWGFPKGRRNYQEKDFNCAIREFSEETGYNMKFFRNIQNILPYEEIFTGSNYKSYKHKYYIMYMNYENTDNMENYQRDEVSKMEWKTYQQCIECIRPYNLEKIRVLTNVNNMLNKYSIVSF